MKYVLQTHLNNSKAFIGLSKTIQNDLIESVTCLLRKEIQEEIQKSNFFAVEADETSDVSLIEQCSIILRYVDPCGYIQELFLVSTMSLMTEQPMLCIIYWINNYNH